MVGGRSRAAKDYWVQRGVGAWCRHRTREHSGRTGAVEPLLAGEEVKRQPLTNPYPNHPNPDLLLAGEEVEGQPLPKPPKPPKP